MSDQQIGSILDIVLFLVTTVAALCLVDMLLNEFSGDE